jgi:uncharacterized membrane protein
MSGIQFEGKCETIEYNPRELIVFKSNKGLDSTITWRLQPTGRETQVTLRFDYQIPSSLLKRVQEDVVVQENEHEVEAMLQNLKSRLELQPVYA